jgi:prepilin-type N-terminal cleavage/methylation domain-containing protein
MQKINLKGQNLFWNSFAKSGIVKPRKGTFTLIELLTVIALISILAAMLLPALVSARNRGKAIECLSRLKQLGVCTELYGVDYQDYIPPSWHMMFGNQTWMSSLIPYASSDKSGSRLFWCPGAPPQNGEVNSSNAYKTYNANLFFYIRYSANINAFAYSNTTDNTPLRKRNSIKRPGEFVSFLDRKNHVYFTPIVYWDADSALYSVNADLERGYPVWAWHGKNASFLHMDGHADNLKIPIQACGAEPFKWTRTGEKTEPIYTY